MAVDVGQTKNEIEKNIATYMMNTHYLNDYNEIYGTNKYLENTTTLEREKLETTLDRLRSSLLRVKQEYLMKQFSIEEYKVRNNIITAVIVTVCILLALVVLFHQDKLGLKLLSTIMGCVIVSFILVVVLIVKTNSYRVETNWDKQYWGPIEKKNNI